LGECPLWVKSRHDSLKLRCPLYPQKADIGERDVRFVPEADGLIGVAVPFRPRVEKNFNHSNECQFFRFNVREDFL
jgi:hypothetical protein